MSLGSAFKVLVLGTPADRARILAMAMQKANARGWSGIARICARRLQRFGVYIPHTASIGTGLRLPHPTAIVIGQGVVIGDNVTIYQNVTLGGKVIGDFQDGNFPEIQQDTVIFAGAVIIGKVKIGRGCIIGANAVVTTDIPDFATAAGAPARVVKQRGDAT
jgi:serine O-acetyltransferase